MYRYLSPLTRPSQNRGLSATALSFFLLTLVFCGLSGPVKADISEDCFRLPPASKSYEQVGSTTFTWGFWTLYHARLYTPAGTWQGHPSKDPFLLSLCYARDFKAVDLAEQTGEEWEDMGLRITDQRQQWIEQIGKLWPNVEDGDTLTLEVNGEGESRFYINGDYLGQIDDPNFGRDFSAIWLKSREEYSEEQQALTGNGPEG